MYTKFKQLFILAALATTIVSCEKRPTTVTPEPEVGNGEMGFTFKNYVGDKPLTLTTETYTNCANEEFQVSKFNYYITNVKLTNTDGIVYAEPESYHLIEHDVAASQHFHLANVPKGEYKSVSFMIGVDSARNTSGAQTGALAPEKKMFWTWNTGYIMAKLEGTSTATSGMFMQHVGGFKGKYTGIRSVTLNFPSALAVNSKSEGEAEIKADILKWFGSANCVNLKDNGNMMMPDSVSNVIANNYVEMFSVTSASATAK